MVLGKKHSCFLLCLSFLFKWTVIYLRQQKLHRCGHNSSLTEVRPKHKRLKKTMNATAVPVVHVCLHTSSRSWSIQEQTAAGIIFEAVAARRGQLSLLGHIPSVLLGQNVGNFIHCHGGAWGLGSQNQATNSQLASRLHEWEEVGTCSG